MTRAFRSSGAWVVIAVLFCGCGPDTSDDTSGGDSDDNVAPTLTFTAPASPHEVHVGDVVSIVYSDDDPDDVAHTDLFADQDADLATEGDQVLIAADRPEQDGASQTVDWDTTGMAAGSYRLVARTEDGTSSITTLGAVVNVSEPPVLNYYRIEGLASASIGTVAGEGTFGTDSSSNVSTAGVLRLSPTASITFDIPSAFQGSGVVLEMQIGYVSGGEAHYRLEDATAAVVASGVIDGDGNDGHQTTTLLVDLSPFAGSATLTLSNPELGPYGSPNTYDLLVNGFVAFFSLEAANDSGIYVADLRDTSTRIDATETTATPVGWGSAIDVPSDAWSEGTLVFHLSDVLSPMTQPIAAFNFGREEDAWVNLQLFDASDQLLAEYRADGDCCEDAGQSFVVDLTASKTSTFFRLEAQDAYLIPFVTVQDAAAISETAVLLDVSPQGRDFVSGTGKFGYFDSSSDYPVGGMNGATVEYGAPHWLADPTHPTYGQAGSLEISLPPDVAAYAHPVVEILHFSPDSEPSLADAGVTGDPGSYPVEFSLVDEDGSEIARVRFDRWDHWLGGVLKNQVPLGQFSTTSTLEIVVPGEDDRWSQAAFPPFIKVFDAGP